MALEILGGADLSENLPVISFENVKPDAGLLVSIDPKNPGSLIISCHEYDKKVIGVISGAGNLKTGMILGKFYENENEEFPIALSGRVYCFAEALHEPILPGDFLTTSVIPGHAMKAGDFEKAQGAIIGKAMSSLEKGTGLVLVMITLQ